MLLACADYYRERKRLQTNIKSLAFRNEVNNTSETEHGLMPLVQRLYPDANVKLLRAGFQWADHILMKCAKDSIHVIAPTSFMYPLAWLFLDDPPIVFFAKGNLKVLRIQRAVAFIGSRRFSSAQQHTMRSFLESYFSLPAQQRDPPCLVSGMAEGCDSLGHWAALRARVPTIGVMAHGLDMVYPSSNQSLADAMMQDIPGGCLISEYPPGTKPRPSSFLARNRLVAAMSQAILVGAFQTQSGTMATMRLAKARNIPIVSCQEQPRCSFVDAKAQWSTSALMASLPRVIWKMSSVRRQLKKREKPENQETTPSPKLQALRRLLRRASMGVSSQAAKSLPDKLDILRAIEEEKAACAKRQRLA